MTSAEEILALEQKLKAAKEARLEDVGELAIVPVEEVTLAKFSRHGDALRLIDPIKYAAIQRNLMISFVRSQMIEGQDYGAIPGTGSKDKPTKALFKAGAERLANLFNFSVSIERVSAIEDYEKGLFAYTYKAVVKNLSGRSLMECEGHCNSKEKKYGQRKINKQYATAKEKESAITESSYTDSKTGKRTDYIHVPNEDIFSIVNTIMKMSQKRAIVGAIILACNASSFFQNAETMTEREIPDNRPTWEGETIDADIIPETEPEPPSSNQKAIAHVCAEASKLGYTPEARDAVLAQGGFESKTQIVTKKQVEQCVHILQNSDVQQWNAYVLEVAAANA